MSKAEQGGAVAFVAGQRVRLIDSYTGKPLNCHSFTVAADMKVSRVLPVGTEFVVVTNRHGRSQLARRLDGPTVLLRLMSEKETWCIPARLLEAVPASDNALSLASGQESQPEPKESGRDDQADRVG